MCTAADADVAQLVEALGIDPRIGHGGMRPGIGYGGGCLPKDVLAFTASAGQLGVDHAETLLLAAEAVTDRRPDYAVQLIDAALDRDLSGARVAMLGAAFSVVPCQSQITSSWRRSAGGGPECGNADGPGTCAPPFQPNEDVTLRNDSPRSRPEPRSDSRCRRWGTAP
ncbi:hypothetical protein [Streptomyces sp. NBC_00572]|uniref:hypothetical protein n=1 Tax=Streptomyces sp. NBC_00572 TaxID=2903664 RepID=UPI002258A246|nr:hypothetical protein [Streptomyces sp. NBC_00572]MCX4985791.1 hypothetical protein [Streptomyces sp. NBC_00572]